MLEINYKTHIFLLFIKWKCVYKFYYDWCFHIIHWNCTLLTYSYFPIICCTFNSNLSSYMSKSNKTTTW